MAIQRVVGWGLVAPPFTYLSTRGHWPVMLAVHGVLRVVAVLPRVAGWAADFVRRRQVLWVPLSDARAHSYWRQAGAGLSVHLSDHFVCVMTSEALLVQSWITQEAQLLPRDRAMHRVSWNLANCNTTVQKLLVRQVLNQESAVANWPMRQNRAVDSAWWSVR